MTVQIEVGGIVLDVIKKNIKNVHLSVNPPDGHIRIAAPLRMSTEAIRVFAISKLGWIRREHKKLAAQERESPREFLDRESHFVWGKRYLLRIAESQAAPTVSLRHSTQDLRISAGAGAERRRSVLEVWYRDQVKSEAPVLIAKWAARLGVPTAKVIVRKMKTKWGSCCPARGTIRHHCRAQADHLLGRDRHAPMLELGDHQLGRRLLQPEQVH